MPISIRGSFRPTGVQPSSGLLDPEPDDCSGGVQFMRIRKPLPVNLPGWGYSMMDRSVPSRKQLKSAKKRKRFLASRTHLNRDSQPSHQRFQSARLPDAPELPDRSGPEVWKICTLTKAGVVLLSRWHRLNGRWRCTEADAEIEWFTRLNHPESASSWIRANNFSVQWSQGQPSRSGDRRRDEDIPAASNKAQNASVPQGNNTGASKNNASLMVEVAMRTGAEWHDQASPLNCPGCPGNSESLTAP